MLRNNVDYIKEQLVREENFVRKEIEQRSIGSIKEKIK